MTDDLVAFLRARLDDDEQAAGEASPGPWRANPESDEVLAVDDITVCDGFALSGRQLRATTAHIARWDPARVLAEVDAKRRLLDQSYPELQWADGAAESEWTHDQEAALDFLKILALPYREHPDYRPEWAPDA